MNRNIIIANVLATIGATGFIASRIPPSALQGLLMVAANPAITAGFSVLDRKISKDTSRKRIDELEKDLAEKSKEFDRLSRELELTKEDLAKLETTEGLFATKPVQREFNDLSTQIEQLNRELSVALHEKSELSDEVEERKTQLVHTEDELFKAEAQITRLKENGGLQVQVAIRDRLNAEREDALKSGVQAGIEQGNRKIDQLEGFSAELLGKVDYYGNLLGQTAEEIEQLQTQIAREKAQLMNQSVSELNARDKELMGLKSVIEANRRLHGEAEVIRLANLLHDAIEESTGIRFDIIDCHRGDWEDTFTFRREANQTLVLPEYEEIKSKAKHIRRSTGFYGAIDFSTPERGNRALLVAKSAWRDQPLDKSRIDRLTTNWDKLAVEIVNTLDQKPTVRVMGATGDGKGIAIRSILAAYCKLSSGSYVRLHDPQHGSVEDYWGVPKASKSGSEMQSAVDAIVEQMEVREADKNPQAPLTVDVLDEIDTQLTRKQKDEFPGIVSRIRHLRMKVILSGQNPKVNRAGFQWSDMGQMVCVYMMSSALDAIKNNPQLEGVKDKLTANYKEISGYVASENEDLPNGGKNHFGLCVFPGGKTAWFIAPKAEDIEIDPDGNTFLESFDLPQVEGVNLSDPMPRQPETVELACPECGSNELAKNGKRKNSKGIFQRYKCKSCDKVFCV